MECVKYFGKSGKCVCFTYILHIFILYYFYYHQHMHNHEIIKIFLNSSFPVFFIKQKELKLLRMSMLQSVSPGNCISKVLFDLVSSMIDFYYGFIIIFFNYAVFSIVIFSHWSRRNSAYCMNEFYVGMLFHLCFVLLHLHN